MVKRLFKRPPELTECSAQTKTGSVIDSFKKEIELLKQKFNELQNRFNILSTAHKALEKYEIELKIEL